MITEMYPEIKKRKIEHDNHASDLYVPVTKETLQLVEQYAFKRNVTTFKDQTSGGRWFDIPFAFTPWWKDKGRKPVKA